MKPPEISFSAYVKLHRDLYDLGREAQELGTRLSLIAKSIQSNTVAICGGFTPDGDTLEEVANADLAAEAKEIQNWGGAK